MKLHRCVYCGQEQAEKLFPPSRNLFHPDRKLPYCSTCIGKQFVGIDPDAAWNRMDLVCRMANIAFVPERWTKLWTVMKEKAPLQYLTLMQEAGAYESIDWTEWNRKWEGLIAEGATTSLHPLFSDTELSDLKRKWGDHYDPSELSSLESMYQGIVASFGVGDEVGKDNARKMAMLSLEIDKCIASGGAGLDKLITPYNKIQANAGFTADNTRDANSFESVSELMLYMEKTGWVKKYVDDVPRDIVDLTIKDIQAHNSRLYRTESTIPDQVEEKIAARKRIEDLENRIRDEEVEAHFDESWRADDGILYPGEADDANDPEEVFEADVE